jgi:hypothetical protein
MEKIETSGTEYLPEVEPFRPTRDPWSQGSVKVASFASLFFLDQRRVWTVVSTSLLLEMVVRT